MRSTRNLRLGHVTINAAGIAFEAAPELSFDASRGDDLHLGIAYNYRESSDGREVVRIRLTAEAPGAAPESHEAHIHDNPALDDSRRGFVSVPVRLAASGAVRVRFRVEADYEEGAWSSKTPDLAHTLRHEGECVVRFT